MCGVTCTVKTPSGEVRRLCPDHTIVQGRRPACNHAAGVPQPHGKARVKAGQAARSRRAQRLRSLVAQAKRKKWALLEGDALARMDARVFKTYFEPALVEENAAAARN